MTNELNTSQEHMTGKSPMLVAMEEINLQPIRLPALSDEEVMEQLGIKPFVLIKILPGVHMDDVMRENQGKEVYALSNQTLFHGVAESGCVQSFLGTTNQFKKILKLSQLTQEQVKKLADLFTPQSREGSLDDYACINPICSAITEKNTAVRVAIKDAVKGEEPLLVIHEGELMTRQDLNKIKAKKSTPSAAIRGLLDHSAIIFVRMNQKIKESKDQKSTSGFITLEAFTEILPTDDNQKLIVDPSFIPHPQLPPDTPPEEHEESTILNKIQVLFAEREKLRMNSDNAFMPEKLDHKSKQPLCKPEYKRDFNQNDEDLIQIASKATVGIFQRLVEVPAKSEAFEAIFATRLKDQALRDQCKNLADPSNNMLYYLIKTCSDANELTELLTRSKAIPTLYQAALENAHLHCNHLESMASDVRERGLLMKIFAHEKADCSIRNILYRRPQLTTPFLLWMAERVASLESADDMTFFLQNPKMTDAVLQKVLTSSVLTKEHVQKIMSRVSANKRDDFAKQIFRHSVNPSIRLELATCDLLSPETTDWIKQQRWIGSWLSREMELPDDILGKTAIQIQNRDDIDDLLAHQDMTPEIAWILLTKPAYSGLIKHWSWIPDTKQYEHILNRTSDFKSCQQSLAALSPKERMHWFEKNQRDDNDNIKSLLAKLRLKACEHTLKSLDKPIPYAQVAKTAFDLYQKLEVEMNEKNRGWQSRSKEHIAKARPILGDHRGLKQVLQFLLDALNLLYHNLGGHWRLFTVNTATMNVIDKISYNMQSSVLCVNDNL